MHVLAQVGWHFDYYTSVKSLWADAGRVRRRQLDAGNALKKSAPDIVVR